MKITAVAISDFKRIHDVRITPPSDKTLILLGGKNRQGKSSTLDALTAAFGGKKQLPADPVRHGADEATIRVELDGGALVINRTITDDGGGKLEVRDAMGPLKAPQAELDKLIGARFLDPHHFLRLAAKDQRAQLMKLIPDAKRIDELEGKRDRAFTRRTEINRDLAKAKGELARLPEAKPAAAPIDVAALNDEAKKLNATKADVDAAERARATCEREHQHARDEVRRLRTEKARVDAEIERLKGESLQLGTKLADWGTDVDTCSAKETEATKVCDQVVEQWNALQPRLVEIDAELAKADAHNRAVFQAENDAKRRAEAAKTVEDLTTESDKITGVIKTIDDRKAEILEAAKLPVENLSVDEQGVTLNNVPFSQASGAEQFRVALALAIAASPGLDDVWIRDGALLDEDHLEMVRQHAEAAGKVVWIERVGTSDPGVIEIRDGKVVAEKSEAA